MLNKPSQPIRLHISCGVVLTLLVLLLAGCSQGESGKLLGTWNIADIESVSDRVVSDSDQEASSKMSVEFNRTGRLVTKTAMGSIASEKIGVWQFIAFDESSKTMQIECQLGGQTTQHDIEFLGDHSIEWIPPNMAGTSHRIKFDRKN